MPHVEITAAAHDKATGTWRGVPLADLLVRAGASFVRVTATDRYQVVFALSDLTEGSAMARCCQRISATAPFGEGRPYRLLVPENKRPARRVAM
jgi:hypothetical protein